jgi:glycosyltransferase involved in cell wall biosynthesis
VKGGAGTAFKNLLELLEIQPEKVLVIHPFNISWLTIKSFSLILFSRFLLLFSSKYYDGEKLSLGWFNCGVLNNTSHINKSVHLHWFQNETVSVKRLLKQKAKSIITLHDEWLYSSIEHYKTRKCYSKINSKSYSSDIIRKILSKETNRQKLLFANKCNSKFIITVPTKWMYTRAKNSKILRDFDIRIVPNAIDTDIFSPTREPIKYSRSLLNIEKEAIIFLSGAASGSSSFVKGFDLLDDAFNSIANQFSNLAGKKVVWIKFGTDASASSNDNTYFNTLNIGHIYNREHLAELYSLADFCIVPSRYESFGQVCAEAMSCSTPVIALKQSAAGEMVVESAGGIVIEAGDHVEDVHEKHVIDALIKACQLGESKKIQMGKVSRKFVKNNFANDIVKDLYLNIYTDLEG